ncbi:hypothetical protein ACNOYE_28605 [Nannocystaceae bacterium ST9]
MLRALAPIVLMLIAVLLPRELLAGKDYGVVTVDLRPEIGEVPTHLCVVSQGQGPRTRELLSELLLADPSPSEPSESDASAGDSLELDPKLWSGAADPAPTCSAEGACSPRVELPLAGLTAEQMHVACTTDSLLSDRAARDPRVLVLMLEHLEGSPPSLESLKLTGGVVTIGVGADLSRIIVTARSLGGHYDAHGRAFRAEEGDAANKLILLPIAPRCHGFDVELPGVRVRESDRDRLHLRADGRELEPATCVGPLRGSSRMRVILPRAEASSRLEVEVELAEDERPTATRFAAGWDTTWPEGELVLDPHQIGFVWSPPACVWPTGTCPAATIEGGIECSATPLDDGTCQYLCPGGEPSESEDGWSSEWVELEPPLAVTFRKADPDQRWTEILQRPGQTLASYVPADQIYLGGDVKHWKTEIPGSGIDYVELLGSDGAKRRYAVDDNDRLRILAPGASCDPQRFRLIGDRSFKEGSAEVRDGAVEFGPVHRTARLLTFNILIAQGGGIVLSYGGAPDSLGNPIHLVVLGQIAANFRPRDPRFARVAYELRIGGTIGQWGYFGPGSIGDDPRRVTSKLAWGRLLFEPAVVVDVLPVLAFSFGFGVGGSWPIRSSAQEITDRFNFVLSPSLDARFTIRRWIALILQGRAFLRERSAVATGIDGTEPVYQSFPNVSLVGLYGVELRF